MPSGPRPSDVAVIGLSCRFPAAADPSELWNLLREGREATRPLDDIAAFDADFFTVSPREARAMDPRQRLALELTWELLEDAFVVPEALRGQQVGVYLGAMNDDYAYLTLRDTADNVDHHSFTGSPMPSACAARAWPSTPGSRRHWLRCIWLARACAAAR